eukprot:CAMPEP_0206513326 /NCGR_PEP_ID=MMETSP0324_2-20121206/61442_1 /ASSEMBLY_ACC=CAM_ASM_000836 /TAXON_ID=2866 /ORGANISM="Crypthecodinium cohnii, Strain Seligo" /LENGTH=74 /DNA_ID=CAMNT_0054005521 /DNA_START=480 /DNA_END=700 /DNA_ORIENTATION=+
MTQPTLKSNPYTQIPEANAATVIHAQHVQNKPWDPTPEAKKYPNTNSAGTPALYSPMQTSKIIPIMGKVMVKYT